MGHRLLIRGARIITDPDAEPLRDAAVLAEQGRIRAVGPTEELEGAAGEAEVVDAQGHTLMPGLIDCHVHLTLDPEPDPWPQLNEPDAICALRAARNAERTLLAGVTTVRDMGAKNFVDVSLRQAIGRGLAVGPHLLVSGHCLVMTGGHGHYIGRQADGPDDLRRAAREQLRAGVDIIKLMATGGVLTPGVQPGAQQLEEAEMAAAVAEGHKAGRRAAAHAQGAAGIKAALRAGVDSIEHGIFLDPEAIHWMVERRVFLVPTLAAIHHILEHGVDGGIPAHAVDKSRACQEHHLRSFQTALTAGVPIAMGTDAGTPFSAHGDNALELELMVRAGMTPRQALAAATTQAARLLGLEKDRGGIREGMRADMLLVAGDPLADITVLRRGLVQVYKSGSEVVNNRS